MKIQFQKLFSKQKNHIIANRSSRDAAVRRAVLISAIPAIFAGMIIGSERRLADGMVHPEENSHPLELASSGKDTETDPAGNTNKIPGESDEGMASGIRKPAAGSSSAPDPLRDGLSPDMIAELERTVSLIDSERYKDALARSSALRKRIDGAKKGKELDSIEIEMERYFLSMKKRDPELYSEFVFSHNEMKEMVVFKRTGTRMKID